MTWRDKPEWLALIRRPGLAALGPGPRSGVWAPADIERLVARDLPEGVVSDAVQALVLLWNDHHDPSHSIVQNMEQDADGSLVHAILHRREPDYSNAAYWFRRVGSHSCFLRLAELVAPLLTREQMQEFLPGGRWSSTAFCTACERVGRSEARDSNLGPLLLQFQGLETEAALDDFWARAVATGASA